MVILDMFTYHAQVLYETRNITIMPIFFMYLLTILQSYARPSRRSHRARPQTLANLHLGLYHQSLLNLTKKIHY
jgi:hypothetical protein